MRKQKMGARVRDVWVGYDVEEDSMDEDTRAAASRARRQGRQGWEDLDDEEADRIFEREQRERDGGYTSDDSLTRGGLYDAEPLLSMMEGHSPEESGEEVDACAEASRPRRSSSRIARKAAQLHLV